MDEDNQRLLAELQEQNAELQQQMAALQRRHHLLHAVVEGTPDAVFVKDLRGRYLMANSAALNFAGKSIDEVLGHDDTLFFSTETARQIMERDRRIMESGQTQTAEEVGTAAGQTRTFLSTKGPYRDEQGHVIGLIGISRDITARKQAEAVLSEKQRLLSESQRIAHIGSWSYSLSGQTTWSDETYRLFGQSPDTFTLTLESFLNVIHPDDRPAVQAWISSCAAGQQPGDLAFRAILPNGTIRFLNGRGELIDDAQHRPSLMTGTVQDITTRMRIEEALRHTQEQYKVLVDGAIEAIVLHQDSIIRFANPAAAQIFGFNDPLEMIGRNALESLVAPEDRERIQNRNEPLKQRNAIPLLSGWNCLRPDGTTVRIQSSGSQVVWNGRPAILGFYIDVTEQHQVEEDLRQSRERLKILSRQLIATQESERRHLARELHDEIGQSLTGIKLNLRSLQQPAEAARLRILMQDTIAIVDQTLQQVRSLSLELRPSMLDDIGLVAALRWCLDRQATLAGFVATLVADADDGHVDPDVAIACFRVAQEGLTNIARHARAHSVRIELHHRESELELLVHDDGCGFDVAAARDRAARGGSLGLLGMEERVLIVGGKIQITSSPSDGTTINVWFPLHAPAKVTEELP